MKEDERERSHQVRLFETLLYSLKEVLNTRADILALSGRRIPFAYRVAHTLETELKALEASPFTIDMGMAVSTDSKALVPDISVRDKDALRMTVSVRSNYLSEKELLALHTLRMSTMCPVTLAVALLPRSDYLLIYQSDEMFVDYFHYYIEYHHLSFLKRIDTGEIGSGVKQLNLIPSVRKRGL